MYSFIEKASEEPDLSDVMSYLAKIVYAIDEIKSRLSLNDKKDDVARNIQNSCETILNQRLPKLINQYCSMTLKYRNETVIKETIYRNGIVRLTPKDILLKDLAHLLEEAQILEQSFNETNSEDFLIQSHVIQDNYGVQPQILLNGDTQPERVSLQDNFDYKNYEKNQEIYLKNKLSTLLPKKNPVEVEQQKIDKVVFTIAERQNEVEKSIEKDYRPIPFNNPIKEYNQNKVTYSPGSLSIMELLISMIIIMVLIVAGVSGFSVWNKTYHKGKYDNVTTVSQRGQPFNTPHTQETLDASDMLHGEQLAQTFMMAKEKIQQNGVNPDLNLVRFQPFEDNDINQNLDDLGLKMMQIKKLYDNRVVLQVQNLHYKTCMATIEKLEQFQVKTSDFSISTSEASCSMTSPNTLEIILK
jgi:hypothetical protein